MAIITISRGSYSKGKEVAEKVAARLGYDCLSRDVLLDASDRFHTSEIKLIRAIHDAPSILDRFTSGRQRYIAYIQSALTQAVSKDKVVYHGLAGHVLLKGVNHVLKVRIIADMADRIANEMEREKISEDEAREQLIADDEQRRQWTQHLFGVDPHDPNLYDLLIHIHRLKVEDAVDFICHATTLDQFKTTKESQQKMDDLALACQVKAALIDQFPDIAVGCNYGNVVVYSKSGERPASKLEKKAKSLSRKIEKIHHLEVHARMSTPPDAV